MGNNNRILHVDADSFFASCEIALNRKLEGRPVWVGGGRRGDGIVIAANRIAKKFGVKTGMACFEAARLCPHGCPVPSAVRSLPGAFAQDVSRAREIFPYPRADFH